ncbi:MAG: helix-turn-helix transcriptional regulator [Silvibacterium sp.]|nr:helix-turn-helix transcriptional regulator [Silvibacterium sp.]
MQAKTPADIGRIIRGSRAAAGLSQSQLALMCDTTQSWISEIERGKQTAELGMVLKVLSVLKLSLDVADTMSLRHAPSDEGWPYHEDEEGPDIDSIVRGPRP